MIRLSSIDYMKLENIRLGIQKHVFDTEKDQTDFYKWAWGNKDIFKWFIIRGFVGVIKYISPQGHYFVSYYLTTKGRWMMFRNKNDL